jgi:putative DNA primase/helicase
MSGTVFHITILHKLGGVMSKRIWLDINDHLISDGSACLMTRGTATRARVTLDGLGELLQSLPSCDALALGALRDELPDTVNIVTKDELQRLNGQAPPLSVIARTSDSISYRPNQPGLLLVDYDQKGMPPEVRQRVDAAGGMLAALPSVLPQLNDVGSLWRPSTSSGLYRSDTLDRIQGSGGLHGYVGVVDGSDATRALKVLHDRCWLAGYGWMMLGRSGDLLRRSIVDRMVGDPSRLIFEGAPKLVAPLRQNTRPSQMFPGGLLDTRTALPDLTLTEQARLKDLEQAETARLRPDAERVRKKFIEDQAAVIAARISCTTEAARYVVERQCHGVLLPSIVLEFDAPEFAGCTVADVLSDPQRFDRATLADPNEGREYGVCKAMVMRRPDGTPWINSFAHGRTVYELRYDTASIEAAIQAGVEAAAADIAVRMLFQGEINRTDEDRLIAIAAKRAKVGKRAITSRLKDLRTAQNAAAKNAARAAVATSLPEIDVIPGLRHEAADAGIAAMHAANVPFYQRAGGLVRVCSTRGRTSDGKDILVPGIVPVSQPMLGRALNTSALWQRPAKDGPERIDCPRDVVEEIDAMAGHWPFPPLIGVIGTPTLRPDGSLLCSPGYDAATGLYLHEPPPMPAISDRPTKQDALNALSDLNELLNDFPFVDNVDRSVAMSMLMTPVLRAGLGPAVPIHVVNAPAPGTGKSYLQDISTAISIGERCPVKSVASSDEETEKRLIGSAIAGHSTIALDNCNGILRGDFLAQVSERPVLEVRGLGSSTIYRINNVFTVFANGNNIIVYGDLTRRCVRCKLDANLEDPTERTFAGDPVATILVDRGRYVGAILTIALAYLAAGTPNPPHRVPSYERWSVLVCGALTWLGSENPAASMATIRTENPSGNALAVVLAAWPNALLDGASTAELIAEAQKFNGTTGIYETPDWLNALAIARNKIGQLDPLILGQWLAQNRDRMVGVRKLLRCGTETRG